MSEDLPLQHSVLGTFLLPIAQALDIFYDRQDEDGYMCREYTGTGAPFWPTPSR